MGRWKAYAFSIAAVVAAVIVRLLFLQALGNEDPFLVFYPVVAVAALAGGFWPGVLATVLSIAAAHFFWMDPALLHWLDPAENLAELIFLGGGVLVSSLALVVEKARKKQMEAENEAALAKVNSEMQAAEERFNILASVTLEGVFISERGVILDANDQFCSLVGYQKPEVIGKKLADFILDPQEREELLKKVLAGEEILHEYTVVRKDGSAILVEVHGRSAASRDTPLRVTSVRDITAKRQQERDLRDEREKLALFVEHVPVALAMFDREMRYICASRRWVTLNDLGKEDLRGLSHYEVFPNIKQEWRDGIQRGLAGEVLSAKDDSFERADGKVLWVNWELLPWRQSDGSVGGIIIFSEDVTRQKQDEDRLKELTQRLTYHIENSPLVVTEWGPDLRLIRWAGTAERVFGWKAEEVLGKCIEELHLVYEDDQPQVVNGMSHLASGSTTNFSANRNYRKDGSIVFCEWYNSSLLDEAGGLRSILALGLDVTERKRLEESLKVYSENLEATVRERTAELLQKDQLLTHQSRLAAMGEMINTIAHQWRQPLNMLGLHIQSLPRVCELQPQTELETFANDCMRLIRHMSATIDDFRDFFRPDRAQVDFNINTAILKAVELVASGYRHSNINIVTNFADDATVSGYPNQFAQAVLCLLQNARDALRERGVTEGRVVITTSATDSRTMVVTIADNAGGIPDEIKDKIFDPYFSTKGEAGTGIGLFMTKTIIEAMAGSISVENVKEGAEFIIEIPVKASPH